MSNLLLRRILWFIAAAFVLSILEVMLGIEERNLGFWRYHGYMVVSTIIIIAIVCRYVRPRPPS
ncbi:MAG TPA: hypothetical protein VMU12_00180 [Candidatus Paceibacterota bacterium]|nr:hypothetical protein [Candidatus Paceibacterota bacterium]